MRTTPRLLPLSLLFAVATACHTGTEPAGAFAPMPMGETAAAAEAGLDCTVPDPIDHVWADARGQVHGATFRFTYRTRSSHAALAAECVRTRWQDAIDSTLPVLRRNDLLSEQGRRKCEADLQVQLTETLFPCSGGESLATVWAIQWEKRSAQ